MNPLCFTHEQLMKEYTVLQKENKVLLKRLHDCKRRNREDKQRLNNKIKLLERQCDDCYFYNKETLWED